MHILHNRKRTSFYKELLWFGPASQLCRLPSHDKSINVNQCVIKPVTVVQDLGVWFDAELSMRSHVSRVAQTCFYHLRRIRAIQRQLGRDVTARLVTALVLRVWTTATPCWPVFQLPCWHHSSESCTQRHAPFWTMVRAETSFYRSNNLNNSVKALREDRF